jgi:hypothetical protein
MGLCVDDTENPYKLNFEIRRDSIRFYFDKDTFYTEHGPTDSVEMDKDTLERIGKLVNDPVWRAKLFPPKS